MHLRKLSIEDAPLMVEWMHDYDVVSNLAGNFLSKDIQDCQRFIADSKTDKRNFHLAIANEMDEYMGTVSLKNIELDAHIAEFAIVVRKCAMGKGYSQYAMKEIIRCGFEKLSLKKIYWCVSRENKRALRFYEKNGYGTTTEVPKQLIKLYSDCGKDLEWYVVEGTEKHAKNGSKEII